MADSETLMRLIRDHGGDADALMLAAHNPGLQELVLDLVAPENENTAFNEIMQKFPTASFAVLELDIDDWSECARGCGKIVRFSRPRDLDPELGPQRDSF